MQEKRSGGLANILALAIFIVAIVIGLGALAIALSPSLRASVFPPPPTAVPSETPIPPTIVAVAQVPTETATPTEDPLLPTFTPAPTNTNVPATATNTRQPTLTPSITPTFPPATATATPSNTPTETPTAGPSPTQTNTPSPFPFTKSSDSPFYLRNFANTAGCDWLGIAGEVLDTSGNAVAAGQYRVHVWDSGVDERLDTGSAPAYGSSGWEQFVFGSPVIRDYNVQLETVNGTAVSQVYRLQTRSSCNENLLYIIFEQNR